MRVISPLFGIAEGAPRSGDEAISGAANGYHFELADCVSLTTAG